MDSNPSLHRNLKAMHVIGLWPNEKPKNSSLYNVYRHTVFVWFICFTVSQFVEVFYVYRDFKEFTSNIGVSLLYAVGIAKVYIAFAKEDRIKALVNVIRDAELRIVDSRNEAVKRIMRGYISQNWSVTRKFWSLTFWTILGFFVSPSLKYFLAGSRETETELKRPLVFSSWFPFDKHGEGYLYLLAYGIQTVSGTIGASYLGIWDTFIVALMIFGMGQFRILKYRLTNLHTDYDTDEHYDVRDWTELRERQIETNFKTCLAHHIEIINYVSDLDNLINSVMFLDFLVCSLMLCAVGLQVTMEGATIQLGFTVEYLIAILIQLFMFYWYANELMSESLGVSRAAWESQWTYFSSNVRKSMVLVMMRAQRPVTLKAGWFYTMSLETFLLVLRVSYSYLALLRQAYSR